MLSPSGPKYLKMLKSPALLSDSNTLSLLVFFYVCVDSDHERVRHPLKYLPMSDFHAFWN